MHRAVVVGTLAWGACLGGCTLLNSENGLVGPPLVDGGGIDGSTLSDGSSTAHPGSGSDSSVSTLPNGNDAGSTPSDSGNPPSSDDAGAQVDASPPPPPPPDAGPVALYSGRISPLGIGVNGSTLCWVEGDNVRTILCGTTTGGNGSQLTTAASQTNDPFADGAFDVAIDGTYYYWSNGPNNQVVRKAISGGTSAQYFTGDNYVSYIALEGSNVWASDYQAGSTGGNIVVGPAAGSQSMLVFPSETQAAGVANYSGSTYWGRPTSVSFAQEQGNVAITRVTTAGQVTGLAIDGSGTVYFLSGNQQIYKLPLGAATPALVYDVGSSFGDSDLAVDDEAIYWTEHDVGSIMRLAK
jgi:hypothetical protein